ncbi:hypothetical protein ACN469_22835 [Corallococcus terminator]
MSSDFKRRLAKAFSWWRTPEEVKEVAPPWTGSVVRQEDLPGALPSDFNLRLAETIAWCLPRAEAARAGETTRSVELMPPVCGHDGDTVLTLLHSSPTVGATAVDFIAERRREALARSNVRLPPLGTLAGGWVFATDFNTDICGAATKPSNGYLDDYDIPGWDTWFAHRDTGRLGGLVYGWVPPTLLTLADEGFYVIPVSSAWWIGDQDLRHLMTS